MDRADQARLAAWTGASLFVGAGATAWTNSFAPGLLGADGVDVGRLRVLGVVTLVSALVTIAVPWARLRVSAQLSLAVWGLFLLVATGHWANYAATTQAQTAYPVFFVLIFGWLGLNQERGVAALFAPAVVVACGWLTVETPHVTVSFAGLVIVVWTAVLVAEIIAWAMSRSRRYARDLNALVSAASELREVLTFGEGLELAIAATQRVLHAGEVRGLAVDGGVIDCERAGDGLCEQATAAVATGTVRGDANGLAVPLVGPSGTVAVLVARGVARDPVTRQLLRLLPTEFGGRLEQLRVLEALGEQSLRDALTGVGSRRHADVLVDTLQPGDALLLVDVDCFKNVNDTRGHQGGDQVLEALASHLRAGLRDHDAVARYGGDEFLVRLHTNDGEARAVAQRLLDAWRAPGDMPTFSVGIALHARGMDPQTTFAEADRALYEAKRGGRARVAVASAISLETSTD